MPSTLASVGQSGSPPSQCTFRSGTQTSERSSSLAPTTLSGRACGTYILACSSPISCEYPADFSLLLLNMNMSAAASMRRLRDGKHWTLFDPHDVPLLLSTYGDEFTEAYEHYEQAAIPSHVTSALELWNMICRAQQESGTPFIMYPDAINSRLHGEPCPLTRVLTLAYREE